MAVQEQKTVCFEDIDVGTEMPSVSLKLTVPIMMRWCAATEIWRRDHYDKDYATEIGLPDIIGSGSWSRSYLFGLASQWVGLDGWVWKLSHQNRAMLLPHKNYTAWGRVTSKEVKEGLGHVVMDMGFRRDEDGVETVPSSCTIILPLRGGKPVPYPFQPPKE